MSTLNLENIKHPDSASNNISVDSSGNVGIGTGSPSSQIHLNESGSANAVQRIQAATNGYAAQLHLYGNSAGGAAYNSIASYVNGDATPQWEITGPEASAEDQMLLHTGGTERMRIDSAGRVTMPYQPSFQAHRYNGGNTAVAHQSVITYDETLFNVGGSFNTGTGRFTAPVTGNYVFFWNNIGGVNITTHRTHLRKNGTDFNWGSGYRLEIRGFTNNTYPYGSQTVIVPLTANDYVDIYYESTSGAHLYADTTNGISFGGYLIG